MSKKYRPSRLALAKFCRGVVRMSEGVPQGDRSEMEMGRRIHQALALGSEECLEGDFEKELYSRGLQIKDALLMAHAEGDFELLPEHTFKPLEIAGIPEELWPEGTTDLVALLRKRPAAVLVDYKLGLAPLNEEKAATQILAYAAMAFQEWPLLEEILVGIVELGTENVYMHEVGRGMLPEIIGAIRTVIMQCEQPILRLAPSDDVCPSCPGNIRCPAARREVDLFVDDGALEKIEDTPELRGVMLSKAKLVAELAERYRNYCTEQLRKDPTSVKGWKLKTQQGNRHIQDVRGAKLRADGRVGPEQFERCCTKVAVGELETRWSDAEAAATGVSKKMAKERFQKHFEALITRDAEKAWPEKAPSRKEITSGE